MLPWHLLARDLLLVALTAFVWRADAALRGEAGWLPALVAVCAGALAALCSYLAHEWGHLLAARASGSAVHFPERPSSAFLFFFDVGRNGRRQFLAMSLGGFAASAAVLAWLLASLPDGALSSRVALLLVALGLLATLATELPPFLRVLRGAPLPRGLVYRDGARQGA
jgi:hypothetical protein